MAQEPTHNDFETLCSGYVLGALSPDEEKVFEEMLENASPEQQELYEDLLSVRDNLARSVEPVSPSPQVEKQILNKISQPKQKADKKQETKANIIPMWVYKAAAAILLLGTLSLAYFTLDLTETVDEQQTIISELETELERQDELLNVLAAREVKLVMMGGLDPSPDGFGKILWDTDNRRAVLQLANLPTPPEDKDYQLWLIKDDQSPISAGVFNFDQPSTDLFFKVEYIEPDPSPVSNTFAVTLEPKGGVPQPTGDMFLVGEQE